jgi:AAA domain
LRQIFLEASQGAIGAYRPNGYGVDAEGCVILLRAHDGPAIHARQLLEHLSERVASEKCPLAKRLTQVRLTANRPCLTREEQTRFSDRHVAQMGSRFPLSPDRCSVLMHFLVTSNDGQILAVTGPPGTGKTTLLHTIVANMWTEAAIQSGEPEPPVIVVASTNNQAVTNVTKSFGEINGDSCLESRWVPEVHSLGIYYVSPWRCGTGSCQCVYPDDKHFANSFPAKLQTRSYLDSAETHFLARCSEFFEETIETVT